MTTAVGTIGVRSGFRSWLQPLPCPLPSSQRYWEDMRAKPEAAPGHHTDSVLPAMSWWDPVCRGKTRTRLSCCCQRLTRGEVGRVPGCWASPLPSILPHQGSGLTSPGLPTHTVEAAPILPAPLELSGVSMLLPWDSSSCLQALARVLVLFSLLEHSLPHPAFPVNSSDSISP